MKDAFLCSRSHSLCNFATILLLPLLLSWKCWIHIRGLLIYRKSTNIIISTERASSAPRCWTESGIPSRPRLTLSQLCSATPVSSPAAAAVVSSSCFINGTNFVVEFRVWGRKRLTGSKKCRGGGGLLYFFTLLLGPLPLRGSERGMRSYWDSSCSPSCPLAVQTRLLLLFCCLLSSIRVD